MWRNENFWKSYLQLNIPPFPAWYLFYNYNKLLIPSLASTDERSWWPLCSLGIEVTKRFINFKSSRGFLSERRRNLTTAPIAYISTKEDQIYDLISCRIFELLRHWRFRNAWAYVWKLPDQRQDAIKIVMFLLAPLRPALFLQGCLNGVSLLDRTRGCEKYRNFFLFPVLLGRDV